MSSESSLEKSVLLFNGSNFLKWSMQMKAYLQKIGCFHIVDRTITCPVQAGAAQTAWDDKDEMALGTLTLRLAHNLCTSLLAADAATTWTNIQTM